MKFLALVLMAGVSSVAIAYPGSSLDSSTYVSDSSVYGSNSNSSNGYQTKSYYNNSNNSYGSDNSNYRHSSNSTYGTSPSNLGDNYKTYGSNTYGTGYDNRGYSSTRVSPNSSVVRDSNGNLSTCVNVGFSQTCN